MSSTLSWVYYLTPAKKQNYIGYSNTHTHTSIMYSPSITQVAHLHLNTTQTTALQNLITLSGQFDTDLFIAACDEVADSPLFEGDLWEEVNMCLGWA